MGVDPVLTATEMEDPNIDHLSVMAYLNRFRYAKPVKSDNEKLTIQGDFDNHLTGVQVCILSFMYMVSVCRSTPENYPR